MEPVRIGIIGCGVIGPSHIRGAEQTDLANIVAVADIDQEKAKKVAEEFNIGKVYFSAEELLNDAEVEAVVLALPTGFRFELALQTLAHGKHLLIEKPAAANMNELKQIMDAQGDLVCASCSARYRFPESAEFLTKFIADGNLGDIRVVRCRAVHAPGPPPTKPAPPWRVNKAMNGGGILVNWGVYDLDYLLGITGWKLKPQTILAQAWPIPPAFSDYVAPGSDAEEHFSALICCQEDAVISFERGERVPEQTEDAWQIVGTKGTLQLKMVVSSDKKQIVFDKVDAEQGIVSETVWEGEEDPGVMAAGLIENLATAIRTGKPPKTGMEQAKVIQQITDGIYTSAEQNKAIEVVD